MRITMGLGLVGGLVLTTQAARAQIFQDGFDSYPQGWWPAAFLAVWPADGCARVKIDNDAVRVASPPNSAMQPKDINDNHATSVRHRHDFTGAELQGATVAQPGANAVQGTDENPLRFSYWLDLDYEGWFWHNRFLEITCSTDRAPTPMIWVTCPENGKTRRYLDPNGDGQVHGSILVGVVAMADTTPCGTEAQGDEKHEVSRLVVYDGRYWHILKDYPTPGVDLHTCKRWNMVEVAIRTNEIDVSISSKYNPATEACDNPGRYEATVTIPREYLGAFTAVVMGGIRDEEHGGCIEQGSPGTDIQNNWYRDWMDNIIVQGGEADFYANPCPDVPVFGACCVTTGFGTGICSITTQEDCETNLQGLYLGHGTNCGANNKNCDFCPDPFADADGDGDVDQQDFGAFQRCYSGRDGGVPSGCECFDRENDGDIDDKDFGAFVACASGPSMPADPVCDDPAVP